MTDPILWHREDHTAAKHRVLRSYLDGWLPAMGLQAIKTAAYRPGPPRLLLVDGFAGPGAYTGGEPGSPLLMLDALLSHKALERLAGVQFTYLFIEQDLRRVERLRAEVAALGQLPSNVTVGIEHGAFESTFARMLDAVTEHGATLIPTFAFIDPFGYSAASMSLTGRLLSFPRCEVLIFLPLSHVNRFVGRDGQDRALNALFGCEAWRDAIPLEGAARREFLLALFERQLAASPTVKHVRSFQLRTQDGNDYRLIFGVGHDVGLDLAKTAMWKVDPVAGTSYAARTETNQEILFSLTVDTAPLLAALRMHFGTDWFTIDAAVTYTRLGTPYRVEHLRQKTLNPAIKGGTLDVVRAAGTRGLDGARLRFLR